MITYSGIFRVHRFCWYPVHRIGVDEVKQTVCFENTPFEVLGLNKKASWRQLRFSFPFMLCGNNRLPDLLSDVNRLQYLLQGIFLRSWSSSTFLLKVMHECILHS